MCTLRRGSPHAGILGTVPGIKGMAVSLVVGRGLGLMFVGCSCVILSGSCGKWDRPSCESTLSCSYEFSGTYSLKGEMDDVFRIHYVN